MKEEQNITIKIASRPPIAMTIDRNDEAVIRQAERAVNELWQIWSRRYSSRSAEDVMAMVAFQFARLYYGDAAATADAEQALQQLDSELEQVLLATTAATATGGDDRPAGATPRG